MRFLPPAICLVLLFVVNSSTSNGSDPECVSLFNGKNLEGWHLLPGGEWKVVDGVIVGTSSADELRHGLLITDEEFQDFDVNLMFRVVTGDSGFYFRASEVGGVVGVHGFQVEVDDSLETGGLYETGGRGWVIQPDVKALGEHYTPGEWSELRLSVHGGNIVVCINGFKTAELANDPGSTSGHLALQLHGSMEMHVEYKNIEICPSLPQK